MKVNDQATLEVLAAIGAWALHNAQGRPELTAEVFRCLVPQFQGRYPQQKLLSHWCEEAREPVLVVAGSRAATVYIVAGRLSVKLPSGEVLSVDSGEARELAELLFARGFALDDVCVDSNEGERSPLSEQVRALQARLKELGQGKKMGFEDVAEDLTDPEVQARLAEFVRNRHYPADTYRVQDGCANCRHVFKRETYEEGDTFFCTFNAAPLPPCMSLYMGESDPAPMKPRGANTDAHETWDAWKTGREVLPQGICGEWETSDGK